MTPTFLLAPETTTTFGFVEVTVRAGEPIADPFRSVTVTGTFTDESGKATTVSGFCDAQDGSVYRLRFMPTVPGDYSYKVTFQLGELRSESPEGNITADAEGNFNAEDEGAEGLLQVDPQYPYHFVSSQSGNHFFWNATTAYMMAGLTEEEIEFALARLGQLGVNRIRVSLSPSRQKNGGRWFEPQVAPDETFTFHYSPWLVARPDSTEDPGFDVTRFNVAYWQKFDRLVLKAGENGIIVQVIFFTDGQEAQNYPFDRAKQGEDEDERRYYAYAAARLAAFPNVEWCITNEWRLFRNEDWCNTLGSYLSSLDPYGHLMSVHGHEVFPFRTSEWADMALFQLWDEHGGYKKMLELRQEQAATGRPMPQINEEYGYEDHYPQGWGEGRQKPARSQENRLKLAWEIAMAGCYSTTGESAENGLGGWINGRGYTRGLVQSALEGLMEEDISPFDPTGMLQQMQQMMSQMIPGMTGDVDESRYAGYEDMTLLVGHRNLVDFFTEFEWWKLEPRPDLAGGAMCLAEPGVRYVVYLPENQPVPELMLDGDPDDYDAQWYDIHTGEYFDTPPTGDRVLLLEN